MKLLISLLLFSFSVLTTAGESISPLRQDELHALIIDDCGSCHGSRLLGGLGPDLSQHRLQQLPRDLLINTVLNGRPGTAMPPWNTMLSLDEVSWIVDQLRQGVKTP